MCAIFGAYSRKTIPLLSLERLAKECTARGRDGRRHELYQIPDKGEIILGNCRAAPTTELEKGKLQPYDGLVHNGTISNDKELGHRAGEIDSEALSRHLNRGSIHSFLHSLEQVKGSYALACVLKDTLVLARNYKPLYYINLDGVFWFASMPYMLDNAFGLKAKGIAPVELTPYSVLDVVTGMSYKMDSREANSNRVIVVASAGLDSTTVATHYASMKKDVMLLHFTYGCQAQTRELECIQRIADSLEEKFATSCKVRVLSLPYEQIKTDSPLLTGGTIAGGVEGAEYAFEWVPARNLLMTAAAVALAEAEGYGVVSLGLNIEESGAYPDNEEAFTQGLNNLMQYAVSSEKRVIVECPYDRFTKREIVADGLKLGAPYEHTWSCYRGGEISCGHCGPDTMRQLAFHRNGVKDPIHYEKPMIL